mgnify:CR=1 FL=1
MTSTEQLLENADEGLADGPCYLDAWVRLHAGARLAELEQMYAAKNGFIAFDRALRVFPAARPTHPLSLSGWNKPRLWRDTYGSLAEGLLFFADDIFGGQFCIKDSKVFVFEPETGAIEWLADDLEGWAACMLAETDVYTGRPLALDWQEKHGPLDPAKRLIPTLLFTLGGEFTADNLVAKDAVTGMRIRGPIAQEIHDLPDGTQIRLVVKE